MSSKIKKIYWKSRDIKNYIRSILEYIEWNELKYLKEQNVIKHMIIYLKVKVVLWFDNASNIFNSIFREFKFLIFESNWKL